MSLPARDRRRAPLLLLVCLWTCPAAAERAESGVQRVRLSASLFGETVGEVHLTRKSGGTTTTLTYRSDLLVVRNKARLRQQAFIESTLDSATGSLLKTIARRCSGPANGSSDPVCTPPSELSRQEAAPALASEMLLARLADGSEHCIAVIDEETAIPGKACATGTRTPEGVRLSGTRLGESFEALVEDGLPVSLDLPRQGARFTRATGAIEVSDEDLFAEPIPSGGDVAGALRKGSLHVRLFGPPEALRSLEKINAPGQSVSPPDSDSLLVDVHQVAPPKGATTRRMLSAAALLVAKASGSHADCQAATAWFLTEARRRHWSVRPAVGIAYVAGRFAYHSWAILDTPGGAVPVDPLLAQVPADAGHLQLATPGESAGAVLVTFRRGLSLSVE
jgi:hypothetical protein